MSGRKTLLLVEDEPMIALTQRKNLEQYGYDVITASSGNDAVEKTRSGPDIDLVLMDIGLDSGMDGAEAASVILSERNIPLVFLSGHTGTEVVKKTEKISSYGYVVKNSGITILDAAIKTAFKLFEETRRARESEERYRRLVEISPDAIFINQGGTIVFVNRACADLLGGGDPATVLGKSPFDFIHPDYHEMVRGRIGRILSDKSQAPYQDMRMFRPDGTTVEVETTAIPFATDAGPAIQVVVRDISARKRADRKLRESEERLRLFIEHAPAALAMFDRDMRYLAVSNRWLADYNLQGKNLVGMSHYEVFPEIPEEWKEVHRRALAGEVIRSDADRFPRDDGTVQRLRWEVRPWKGTDGAIGGILILSEDITERKRMEEELRRTESLFRGMFEQAAVGMAQIDSRTGEFLRINRKLCDITGYSATEMTASTFQSITHPDDLQKDLDNMDRLLAGEIRSFSLEKRYIRKDGDTVWVNLTVSPLWDPGAPPEYHLAIVEDITERKRAERNLRESEERFARVFHSSPACQLISTYPGGKIVDVNEAYCRLIGRAREGLLGRTTAELGIWRSAEDRAEAFRSFAADGRIQQREVVFTRGTGELITVLASVEPIELRGESCVVSTVVDITERRKAAAALRQSEERYRRLVEISPDAVFINQDDVIVYANPAMARLIGAGDPARIVGKNPLEIFHPASLELVKERIKALRETDKAVPAVVEKVLRLDGSIVMAEVSAIPFELEGGRAIQVIMRDISERLAAEAALADSEERYRGIFEGASQGIIMVDLETGRFRIVNPAMCRMFGYDADAFRDLAVSDLHPAAAADEARKTFALMARGNKPSVQEFPCVRKDGTTFFADIAASLVTFDGHRYLLGFFTEVTERVDGQKLLRESEERYRSLIENSHDLIQSADADGRFIFVNDAWLRTMEYSREDLGSIGLFDVVHPDSRALCEEEFRQVLSGKAVERISPVFVTRSGRALDLEGNVVPHVRADGTVITNAFFNEVTERKRDEVVKSIRLAASQALYRPGALDGILAELCRALAIASSLDFGEVWWLDPEAKRMERRVAWAGDGEGDVAARDFFAASEGMTFARGEGMPGRVWAEGTSTIFTDLANHPDFLRRGIAGKLGVESVVGIPIGDKGKAYGAILLFGTKRHVPALYLRDVFDEVGRQAGDVVARKTLEIELELERRDLARRVDERTSELRGATAAAEAANRAKSDFLASMSHELRTPLNSIIGFSEVMIGGLTGELTAEQEEYLGDIHASGKHLLSLINDILDLSKVEAGKMELRSGPVSVRELLRTTMALFKERSLKHGIALRAELRLGDEEDQLTADERKIKQVLFNLVSNAVKFTPDGGTVEIGAERVLEEGRPFIEFWIRDTGIGIAPADRKRLFLPFSQLDGTSTRNYGGTGLGLSICKSFVELHGGKIWLESEEGKGSTFHFAIPADFPRGEEGWEHG